MSLTATHQSTLARVKLAIDGLTASGATIINIEHSLDDATWTTVRHGEARVVSGDTMTVYDYEYSPDVTNYYRVTSVLPISFVNVGTASHVDNAGAPGSQTFNLPASIASGDLLVAWVSARGQSGSCVDADTEILTRQGWKRYDQVQAGDHTRAINPDTGEAEWVEITRVRHFTGAHAADRVTGPGLDAVATAEHNWLVRRDGAYKQLLLAELLPGDLIPLERGTVPVQELTTVKGVVNGVVWCPTTEHANWLARRNGCVFYTGNKPS